MQLCGAVCVHGSSSWAGRGARTAWGVVGGCRRVLWGDAHVLEAGHGPLQHWERAAQSFR